MFHLFTLILIVLSAVVLCYTAPENNLIPSTTLDKNITKSINGKFMIIDDIGKARAILPNAKFSALNRVSDNQKGTIVYTLGRRVNGDQIVATDSDSGEWATAKDIELLIQYPHSGRGAVVSYVVVLVDQGSNVGDGYIVSGGIGQRQIGFVIEAKSTTFMNYDAFIYGRP